VVYLTKVALLLSQRQFKDEYDHETAKIIFYDIGFGFYSILVRFLQSILEIHFHTCLTYTDDTYTYTCFTHTYTYKSIPTLY
jgi:hypothetical protein